MARLAVYEAEACRVIFGGIPLGDGRAKTFLKIKQNGPSYVMTGPGADGQWARCGTSNKLYELTMSFMGTSSEHAILTGIHDADRGALNGAGVAPLFVQDGSGSTIITTDRCWIVGMPEQGFGVEKDDVDWTFNAIIEISGFLLGGN